MSAPTIERPAPVQVLPASAERGEWLAARRAGIGASEIAAVLGISPWESPFSCYWRKVHGWDVDVNDDMATGTRLEPVVAEWWADEHDPHENLVVLPGGLYAHPDRPWQLATPDRLLWLDIDDTMPWTVTGVPPLAALECKWVAHSWDGWGEPGTDDIPVYYRAQCLWQADVLGVDTVYVAALGPGGFRAYEVQRDEKDLAVMREAGRRFWARIAADDPPDVDEHTATIATLKHLHPDLADREQDVEGGLAAAVRRARALKSRTERLCDRLEARLRHVMGDAHRATHGGRFVASRSIYTVAEHVVREHTVDRLNYARSRKP